MLIFLLTAVSLVALDPSADKEADKEMVRRAAVDYIEGIYEAKPELIERSVHPELAKRGFWFNPKTEAWQESKMPYARLVELASTWNKAKKDTSKLPKEVVIFEVLSHTANVKVVADWGADYTQLTKSNGKWMIVNIVWQSQPAQKSGS